MKVAILDDYQDVALKYADWASLDSTCDISVFNEHLSDPDELKFKLHPFDVICLMRERTPLKEDLIQALPNLKLIITAGARNAAIDVEAATRRGIPVCGTRRSGATAAELALTLIMAQAKNLLQETRSVAEGGWQVGVGRDLKGASLGVIGLGNLGGELARIAIALGMKVSAWSPNLTETRAAEAGVAYLSKKDLFSTSDFVTIHLVLSERTRHVIGADEFKIMKPNAFLVNTSRAEIVDTGALIEALDAGIIAGAAVDVFDVEPLPKNSVMRCHPKLIATPHIGFVTEQAYTTFYGDFVENIHAFISGNPLRVL